jgi:hypothetical protein
MKGKQDRRRRRIAPPKASNPVPKERQGSRFRDWSVVDKALAATAIETLHVAQGQR